MGPVVEYAAESVGKEIEIHINPGKDASFVLYQDEGDSYRYEEGACSRIPLQWNEKKHRLTIGAREGAYPGMPINQPFRIVLDQNGVTKQKSLVYQGKSVTVF